MANARKVAVNVLLKIENEAAYSNISLNNAFKGIEISAEDKALATALVYGVLDRRITLHYVLKKFIKTPLKRLSPYTLSVLETALYQIMYMDKIPDFSAVDEAVKLIKRSKENKNSGFVNAVLRNILRQESLLPSGETAEDLSVIYSCPIDIVKSFLNDYGKENTTQLLKQSLLAAPVTIKVNTVKTTVQYVKDNIGANCVETDIENALVLKSGIDISNSPLYKDGLFYVQDLSSQKVVSVLNPKSNERMLDLCAAPGGKTFSAAISMQNKGEIISCDIHEHRVELIAKSAKRLGLDIVNAIKNDATVYNSKLGLFDCVLCDVPCSGLGIIRRKPDIKYKDFKEFDSLCEIQLEILKTAAKYLKKGGRILYSTCTLRKAENEGVVNSFLMEYNNFHKKYEHTFLPHIDGTDGFYCALLELSK